jgi:hypothetical protein
MRRLLTLAIALATLGRRRRGHLAARNLEDASRNVRGSTRL